MMKSEHEENEIPQPLITHLEMMMGSSIIGCEIPKGGHTIADKWIVKFEQGDSVFVKCSFDEQSSKELFTEQRILKTLSNKIAPTLLGGCENPPASFMQDLSDGKFSPAFSDGGKELLSLLHRITHIDPPTWLYRLPKTGRYTPPWRPVKNNPEPFLRLGLCSRQWLAHSIDTLIQTEQQIDRRGNTLVHGDITDTNICYTTTGAVLVDWGWACIGNHSLNISTAMMAVRIKTGITPNFECRDAGVWATDIAGRMALNAPFPLPPHVNPNSDLREKQGLLLKHALEWAVETLPLEPLY